MAKRYREPRVRKLNVAKPNVRELDVEKVAAALGANVVGKVITDQPSPLSLYQLRRDIFQQLSSRDRRRADSATNFYKKIPLSKENWKALQALADKISADLNQQESAQVQEVSPNDIASRLIHLALEAIRQDETQNGDSSLATELHDSVLESAND